MPFMLLALLRMGMKEYGCRTITLPKFFCRIFLEDIVDIVRSLLLTQIVDFIVCPDSLLTYSTNLSMKGNRRR